MKFCTECGAQLSDGVKFCTECGARLAAPAPAPEPVYEAPAPAEPVYEAPAPAEPVYEAPAPVEPVYEAPAAPVYEPPVQESYTPPVQETYTPPVQETYTPPVQETYTPPVEETYTPPVQQNAAPPVQGTYTPPVQGTYTPPVQQPAAPAAPKQAAPAESPTYVPPVISGGGCEPPKPPKAPKAKKPGGSRKLIPIIAGVAVLVVLLIVLLVSCGGKDQGTEADWGIYEGVSCQVSGMELGADGEWVELQKKGKATLFIMGEEYSAKWTLDGQTLVIKQGGDEFAGTLKNGVIEVDMAGMLYTFSKEGAAPAPAPEASTGALLPGKGGKQPEAQQGPIAYKLVSFTAEGEELGSDMVEMMGGGYIVFNGDGTGIFSVFGETFPITYTDEALQAAGESMPYTRTDGGMEISMEGSVLVLEVTDEVPDLSAPAAGDGGEAAPAEDVQAWSGDYYGFWVVDSVWGNVSDWVEEGAYWDACATVELNADGSGTMIIWDEDFTKEEPLAELSITATMTGGVGRFVSEEGTFLNQPLGHADWLWYTDATEFGDLFVINGQFDDGEDDFWYEIYLRPWGVDWSDVLAKDPNMDPYYYESWYLPLVDSGVEEAPVGKVGQ